MKFVPYICYGSTLKGKNVLPRRQIRTYKCRLIKAGKKSNVPEAISRMFEYVPWWLNLKIALSRSESHPAIFVGELEWFLTRISLTSP